MRLLVVGRLSGQLASAVKMAMAHGAKVNHVERADQATEQLRRGQGADLLMVDYQLDIAALIAANEAERITIPVVAFGVDADAREAAAAISKRASWPGAGRSALPSLHRRSILSTGSGRSSIRWQPSSKRWTPENLLPMKCAAWWESICPAW